MRKIKFTLLMLLCNMVAFVLYKEHLIGYWGIVVIRGELRDWWTLMTYGFFHTELRHLVLNMAFILLLSGVYEIKKGMLKTIIIYFTGIISGGVFYIVLTDRWLLMTLGASGAWYSILGGLLASSNLLSKKEILAVIILTVACFYDTFTATNINVTAHVTAFITGICVVFVFNVYEIVKNRRWRK